MKFTGERFIPGQTIGRIILEHMQRYHSVANLVKGKVVLDAACGEGYGSAILAESAATVTGIDISAEAVHHASDKYKDITNLSYVEASIAELPFADHSFDVIISFETIEHVTEDLQNAFLAEIQRVLRPDGILVMSSPDKRTYSELPDYHNEFHVREFYADEFECFLQRAFKHVALFRQGIESFNLGMIRNVHQNAAEQFHVIGDFAYDEDREQYIIAVCSNEESVNDLEVASLMHIPEPIVPTLFVDSGNDFNEVEKLVADIIVNKELSKARFDLADYHQICRLRFDPVEQVPCEVIFSQVRTDIADMRLIPLNAEKTEGDSSTFFDTDPIFLIEGDFSKCSYLELEYRLRIISPVEAAMRYREVLDERNIAIGEINQLNAKCLAITAERDGIIIERDNVIGERNNIIVDRDLARMERDGAIVERDGFNQQLHAIYQSRGYRLLQKAYKVWHFLLPVESRRRSIAKKLFKFIKLCSPTRMKKGLKYLLANGPREFWRKLQRVQLPIAQDKAAYAAWIAQNEPSVEELAKQSKKKFAYEPLISVIVPTFNTKEEYLRDMLDSILKQSYGNWELCIADGGSSAAFEIERILAEYASRDKRIRYTMLGENKGIAGNTNAALTIIAGEYVALVDHDDILPPFAFYEVVKAINEAEVRPDFIYSDEDKFETMEKGRFMPYYKSDFSIDLLRSYNYIGHLSVVRHDLFKKIGGFNDTVDGSQDYDLVFRIIENTDRIVHIRKVLYHWRMHELSVAANPESKLYAYETGRKAIEDHLKRMGFEAQVDNAFFIGSYKTTYAIHDAGKVSIIIPSKDHIDDLKVCIDSILAKTTYPNYEIVIVENNSSKKETFAYYDRLSQFEQIKVVKWNQTGFNFSAIVNCGVAAASGEYVLLLNNDTEVITPEWIEMMVMYLQRDDVGVVGAKLYYEDDTIQHAGVFINLTGAAGHMSYQIPREATGYFGRAKVAQNVSAVTGACLMTKRNLYLKVGGFDEELLKVAYNDVDFCMKIRALDKLIVFTPFAELYHYESKSRGYDTTGENFRRWSIERANFIRRWVNELQKGDPYYSDRLY